MIIDNIPLDTPCNRRPATKREIKYIVVHNTGNAKSTARNERDWLTNKENKRQASYNYVIDGTDIIQCIPDDEVTWNAGDGHGDGNIKGLSIEICELYHDVAVSQASKFIAKKLLEYGLNIASVKPHQYFSGKGCPRLILPMWNKLIDLILYEVRALTKDDAGIYESDVEWAKEKGITDGSKPNETITKAQFCAMLRRYDNARDI